MVTIETLHREKSINTQNGCVALATCNRTEIYKGDGEIPESVIRHLFRVTTGLESSLVGEKAIQGQVKEAYIRASVNKLSTSLHKLFQQALYVGKKVRTETGINRGAVSHSQATVDLLLTLKLDIRNSFITIIGAHNMNDKILFYLTKKGARTTFIGNRTYNKAKDLAAKYDSTVFHFDHLKNILNKTDILITSTSAPHPIIKSEKFPRNRSMTIIDLAVPSDIEDEIKQFSGVRYINNTGVEKTVNQNLELRTKEIEKAQEIVESEIDLFLHKLQNNKERKE